MYIYIYTYNTNILLHIVLQQHFPQITKVYNINLYQLLHFRYNFQSLDGMYIWTDFMQSNISHIQVYLTKPRIGESCSIKLFTWCKSQGFTYHNRVLKWPRFVTDSTPLTVIKYLKTTRVLSTRRTSITTNKTYF